MKNGFFACWLGLFGVLLLFGCGAQQMPLPVDDYLENPQSFAGNRYALRAEVASQLRWEEDKGRLLVVNAEGNSLVVFVPAEIDQSVHVGQHFEFSTRIMQDGLVRVEALEKY